MLRSSPRTSFTRRWTLASSQFDPGLTSNNNFSDGDQREFDHRTKVKARSERQNLQTVSQLCTKQVGTGEINQIIESLLKVKVQRITKTY